MIALITEPFFLQALAAGFLIALMSGPLGCFVVWRKMAYFGDAIAHSALFGISLSLAFSTPSQLSILVTCLSFALLLIGLRRNSQLSTDTLLGILAHGSLALGLIVYSFSGQSNAELHSLLFGDLLSISRWDIIALSGGTVILLTSLYFIWTDAVLSTLSEELAAAEGVNTQRIDLILMLLMAIMVAFSLRLVGVLLITALLIIPAAAARQFAQSPKQMAFGATVIGILSVTSGLLLSAFSDTPPAPSIVISACVAFTISQLLHSTKKRKG